MRFKSRYAVHKGELDIAPLIDVIFLLLIFFMLTSSFIFQPGIRVDLPKAITSEVIERKNLILTITRDNKIYVNERALSEEELLSRLRIAAKESNPILIKSDRRSQFGEIVRVWDMCRREGVKTINIATTQEGV